MRRFALAVSALALGFIAGTSDPVSACSWRGNSNCVTDDYDDLPVYRYYPPRPAYNYYIMVRTGPYGRVRLLRVAPPRRDGLFPPTVYYPPPAYDYAPAYRRRHYSYDYD
jgi:hypothetical protein